MTATTTGSITVARLTNVMLGLVALQRAMERPRHLPGMVVFHGPSGWGKSTAAAFTANSTQAYYVECKSSWTRKALLLSILKEMGIEPAKIETGVGLSDPVQQALKTAVEKANEVLTDILKHNTP